MSLEFHQLQDAFLLQQQLIAKAFSPAAAVVFAEEFVKGAKDAYKYIGVFCEQQLIAFAGYVPSWMDGAIYDISWVTVHPDWQRQGIGAKLLTNLFEQILVDNPGAKAVQLSTKSPDYYRRLGFTEYMIHGKQSLMVRLL